MNNTHHDAEAWRETRRGSTRLIPAAPVAMGRAWAAAVAFLCAVTSVSAQSVTLPLEFKQVRTHYNFQTTNGVPISNTRGNPPGSDGRAPGPNPGPIGTTNQFQGLLTFGGTVTTKTGATNAAGSPILIALRTRAGNPVVGSSFAYLFGDIIPPPGTDEYGVSLALPNGSRPPTPATTYWLPEPHSTNRHANAAYYWSPHAETVYAAQPGAVTIVWRKAQPSTPSGSPPDVSVVILNGLPYTLYTKREVVSVAAVKRPKRMYWTEGPFAQLGRPITIPTDRIKDIKIVYNDQLPQFTPMVQVGTNGTNQVRLEWPFDGSQTGAIAITNSLWYDRTLNSLRAYNFSEKRVFVEFLGDKRGQANNQDIYQQLGYEIVELIQRPSAADVTADLGDVLTPFQDAPPEGTPELFADPILNLGQEFVHRHSLSGTREFEYFAVRETQNQNDYLMHWMEEGLQGLRWPYRYVRYQMVWPANVAKYSHYVRPAAATASEASATAVALPAQNAPQIAYQDPLDQPRGKLTENFAYFSWLTPQYPAHRALLQFTSGEYVRFERIFSWLDASLRDNSPPPAANYPRYTNGFVAVTAGAATYGNSYILNNRLALTTDLAGQNGAYVINEFTPDGQPVESFKATFLVRMSATNALPPADGFSFNFGTLPDGLLAVGEEGIDDGIVVSFDLWDNGPNDYAPGIQIKANGAHKAAVSMGASSAGNPGIWPQPTDPATGRLLTLTNGLAFVPVEIEMSAGGTMDVSFKGVKVLQNIHTGYTPRRGRFGFFARTGGASSSHEIDNLSIVVNLPPPPRSYGTDFASAPGGATAGGAATVSGGFLHLTDAVGGQDGSFVIDEFSDGGSDPVASFTATFKASLRDSNCCGGYPADGFSFNFGSLPNGPIANGEEGTGDGLVVSFDLWDNGPNDYAPGIEIKLDGRHIAAVRMADPDFGSANAGMLPVPNQPATTLANSGGLRGAFREVYPDIFGLTVEDLTNDPRFPANPSQVTLTPDFEAPTDVAENYGQRLRALLIAPANGLYRFAIASDDASELWISTDANPANRTRVATVPTWDGPREYLKDTNNQISATINLRAGQLYFIEALMKEGNGGDNLSVAWQVPGGPAITNGTPSIPGASLIPYTEAKPMTLTTGPQFVPVAIELRADGMLDVSYKGVKVLQNVATGYTPRRGRFGFLARTGGANSTHWIDDLSIVLDGAAFVNGPAFAGTVATNLNTWIPGAKGFNWPDIFTRPRLFNSPAFVGDRIAAPAGELGGGLDTNYFAGYIQLSQGRSYHPGAYVDPFVTGFDLANRGTIIPVNAIPGQNLIEVWWFRKNQVDAARGFRNAFWPAVIARYTTAWPTDASEIILASNDGSGALPSLEAKGSIYIQNDPSQPGYNPNEEHALMQGGQAYALRDDLNLTAATVPAVLQSPGATYSSDPFLLLQYSEADGKVAIHPFRVRREKPEAGITFEYQRRAAQILQPPMPLPLLGVSFAPKLPGTPLAGLNQELVAWNVTASTPGNSLWTLTTDTAHGFLPFWPLALQDTAQDPPTTRWFVGTNMTENTVEGVVSTNRPAPLSRAGATFAQTSNANRWRFGTDGRSFPVNSKALLVDPESKSSWPATITAVVTAIPSFVEVDFGALRPPGATNSSSLQIAVAIAPLAEGAFNDWRLAWNELPQTTSDPERQKLYASSTVTDRKGNVWVYRGPHRQDQPESFNMRFYYNTLPGFFFPTLAPNAQPTAGTVTPYLRKAMKGGGFFGDAIYGNQNQDQEDDKNALPITYHPYWPADAPVLQMAETLTTPKRGLPAVRGQTSLQVLYQQSQAVTNAAGRLTINASKTSVVLHDPTREKTVEFDLVNLPGAIRTETSRGKIWFPNLPPHLVKRFWLDPNRGTNGMLVFRGEFVDAPLGDKYLLLNVAGTQDAKSLRELFPPELVDPKKAGWLAAINALATDLEEFVENPAVPGTYIPLPSATRSIGLGEVAEVTDDDDAVDSYALTAVGPDTGHVTLIAGNGLAFTPEGEPVSMEVIRVSPNLYRGELAIIESENPLNERLTLQQVVDLAGHAQDYTVEWRITAPVDGQPPAIYSRILWSALPSDWSHVRFPLASDQAGGIENTAASRVVQDISDVVVPVSDLRFSSVLAEGDLFRFTLSPASVPHRLTAGNRLVMSSADDAKVLVTVYDLPSPGNEVVVSVDPNQAVHLDAGQIFRLSERALDGQPQSIAFSSFVVNSVQDKLTEVWLSLDLAEGLAAKVYLNGGLVVTTGFASADANTSPENPSSLLATPRLNHYFRIPVSALAGAMEGPNGFRTNRVAVEFFAPALPGAQLEFQARVEAVKSLDQVVSVGSVWIPLDPSQYVDKVRAIIGGTADVRSLSDNYLSMRYVLTSARGDTNRWSQWTEPQLAEGWIKRVLKGINPFNQRITDLYNNAVNTDVSILSQAGQRWEGNIALNLESINNYGLIEIYETVLNRGKDLSINADINYGPANDALLLAAGYINDLYMLVGNEAAADAANPTIGIGTANSTYGDIATALFSFKGQLPSLLAEELGLLRGRDDFLVPGVEIRPVYNRLVWNYTRGIDAGEVIYALNYNILDQNTDGKVDANDALKLYPQGHGDAYGHYLTALAGYYHLLLDPNFDWVPRSEAVTVLGKPVSVDYQDERKFAAAAGALARTGKQIFDLTWRQDYRSGAGQGWEHFRPSPPTNRKRDRYWGADHWASRTGVGAYVNWVAGNSFLPFRDPDPAHADTIQQVDRTTVPELKELPSVIESLQTAMDNAESGLTPLGLPEDTVPFDLNPNGVLGGEGNTHFEQIYTRAKGALNNAVVSFDDAKDVTRLMRSEQDSLANLRASVDKQELAYTNALIELFGTPYPEDIGPGKTYRTGFAGPDIIHYMYVDNVELDFRNQMGGSMLVPSEDYLWSIDTQTFTADWLDDRGLSDFNFIQPARNGPVDGTNPLDEWATNGTLHVDYNLESHGFFKKPAIWMGRRSSPGKIQQAISDLAKARNAAFAAFYWADAAKYDLDWALQSYARKRESFGHIRDIQGALLKADLAVDSAKLAWDILDKGTDGAIEKVNSTVESAKDAVPDSFIAGLAAGGDIFSGIRAALGITGEISAGVLSLVRFGAFTTQRALEFGTETAKKLEEFNTIAPEQRNQELRETVSNIRDKVYGMNNNFMTINARLQELDDVHRKYRALLAEGDRIQAEREIFRQRTAAIVQGYRTRDAAFRIFRNEKLERYKSLFDLAAQYSFMAAKAYDYETGLLGTDRGREFINRIVNSRALGVVKNSQPQFAGSNNGDPGLSSVLAEMNGDWSVVKSRLGFSNPDAYGTTVSLRYENFRIITNDVTWKGVMNQARKDNLLDDPDVRRYCLQIDDGTGLPVPGLVFEFGTTVANGLNLFGRPLTAGDHYVSPSSFATKIFAAGVALEGYVGMDDPAANSGAVAGAGGNSPQDPSLIFLDQNALAATPYIYLIPVGVDSMRSPPLGDTSEVRTWAVNDVAIPLPFNIGGSDYSSVRLWQSEDSLTELPFTVRKHQAFRPVSSGSLFSPSIYAGTGGLTRSQWTNNRLIGRSVWNSQWKIVIPGRNLFSDPNEGIERFLRTVRDVKLHFVTYSYSGN